jgi:hypothetical protein
MTTIRESLAAAAGALAIPDAADAQMPTYPTGNVQVERTTAKKWALGVGGGLATTGVVLGVLTLLSRAPAGAIASRLNLGTLAIAGGLLGAGGMVASSALWMPPTTKTAVAMNIPDATEAERVLGTFTGSHQIVQATDGTWAVIDKPVHSSGGGGGGGGRSHYYDDGPDYYDPPSYSPPHYDPPSYDPPSYDPPSYSGNDSTSNGNPDFE